jgi:hypothetical protein
MPQNFDIELLFDRPCLYFYLCISVSVFTLRRFEKQNNTCLQMRNVA